MGVPELLEAPLTFEWDAGNHDKNAVKHGVTIQEAEEAFLDGHRLMADG